MAQLLLSGDRRSISVYRKSWKEVFPRVYHRTQQDTLYGSQPNPTPGIHLLPWPEAMLPLQLEQQSTASLLWDDTIYEALFQEVPIGILVMEAQGEIRFVNQAALSLLGLNESQLLGQTPVDPDWHIIQENGRLFQLKLQSIPVRPKHTLMLLSSRQALRNLVLGVYRSTVSECTSGRPTGERVWLSVNTYPQLGLDGSVERIICTLSDVTNLKAEAKLTKLHECFLNLGSDPDENINRLTALAGELLGGTWALYNRRHQDLLWSLGQWQTPPEYLHVCEPKDYICNEVIERGSDQVFVLQDLQNTSYAYCNPYILPLSLIHI